MNNYRMTIQYDGGRYKGWQRLGEGESSIQGKIEKVLSEMEGKKVEIIGSSRTDAGVHAMAQIANFKSRAKLVESEIMQYLNRYLPEDISVIDVAAVLDIFHSRYNAKEKTYLYRIWNEAYSNPFTRKFSMHVPQKLDLHTMKDAARFFIGEHDFTAFTNARSKSKSMVRVIASIEFKEASGFIDIRIRGDGFLHNMVRRMVGTLIEVGLGEIDAETIPDIFDSMERNQAGHMADACGLYLERVGY